VTAIDASVGSPNCATARRKLASIVSPSKGLSDVPLT